jgi:hypothetical protein
MSRNLGNLYNKNPPEQENLAVLQNPQTTEAVRISLTGEYPGDR